MTKRVKNMLAIFVAVLAVGTAFWASANTPEESEDFGIATAAEAIATGTPGGVERPDDNDPDNSKPSGPIIGVGDKEDPSEEKATGTPGFVSRPDDNDPSNEKPNSIIIGLGYKDMDLVKDTSDADLVKDIEAQPNSSIIGIKCSVSYTMRTEVFSAIQGTTKTIILQSGLVEWRFNGRDINNPKEINVKVEVSTLQYTSSSNKTLLSRLVKDKSASVLSFANNGVLPGKANILVKRDDLFPHSRQNSFWVYYFNKMRNQLEFIANPTVSNDGYLGFDIFHNSDYIITESPIANAVQPSTGSKDNPHTGGY